MIRHARRTAARPRCTRCTSNWAPAWCPSPATTMPVQVPRRPHGRAPARAAASAALFDVSHMGQLRLVGADAGRALESLMPVDMVGLGAGQAALRLLHQRHGGILDDLMITRRRRERRDDLFVIVNARLQGADIAHMHARTSAHRCTVLPLPERALLALQGPKAVDALARLAPGVDAARLHDRRRASTSAGSDCFVTRSRLHRRGRLRDLGAGRRGRGAGARAARAARGQAGRPGRAQHAAAGSRACACTATTSTTTHDAGRGRPHLGDPEGAPHRRRARRRLPGRRRDRRRSSPTGADRASASAWSALERVPVREGAPTRRRARPQARRRDQRHARRRPSTSRSRWPTSPPTTRAAATRSTPRCAASALADAQSAAMPFVAAPLLTAAEPSNPFAAIRLHDHPTKERHP